MGLIKNWINKIVDDRIERHDKGVGEMQYNPLLVGMEKRYNDKHLTRRLLENSVWYSGIEQDLAYFYRKEAKKFYRQGEPSESMNYFWADTDSNFRRIHSGFPQLISEKMVDLLLSNGYHVKVEGDEEETLQEMLDDILQDNDFKNQLFAKSIETESWSGGVAWKVSWNPEVTDYPIIEAWQPENYTNRTVSGRIVEDIFYIYYQKGKVKYRLSEIYGVGDKGAYIDYELKQLIYSTKENNEAEAKWVSVSLDKLDETSDLKRVDFEGYYKRLSMYKPNKLPNSEFRHSYIGESDYSGSYGAFDAVDEVISTWIQEFRDGKLHRYFPEELVLKDSEGRNKFPGGFQKEHILYADSPSENIEKEQILYKQGDLRVDKHVESYKIWVTQILNNSGLSPLTVGLTGLESIDASADSQQEREKVSIRTRNKKAELWKEFLEQFLKTVLEFHLMTDGMKPNEDETYDVGALPEFDVKVTFNDYIIKSKADKTIEVQQGMGTSWDISTGVKYVHDEKTRREQLAIAAKIKLENNYNSITQAELSALQDENETQSDELKEEGVKIVETAQGVGDNADTS